MTAWMLVRGAIGLVAAALLTVFTTLGLLSGSRPLAWSVPAASPPPVWSVTPPPQRTTRNPEPTPVVQPDSPAPVPIPADPPGQPGAVQTQPRTADLPTPQKADRTLPKSEPISPLPSATESPKSAGKTAKKTGASARLVEQLLKGNRQEQLEAAKKLGGLGPDAEAAVPDLCLAMASGEPTLQLAVAEALEQIDPSMRQLMIRLLIGGEGNLEIRKFLTMGNAGKRYIPVILSPAVQKRCSLDEIVDVVARIDRESPINVQRVINWATLSDSRLVREKALSHLPYMKGLDDKRAAAVLWHFRETTAIRNSHPDLIVSRIRLVEQFGPLCKAAAPILRQLKLHEYEDVRIAAERALIAVDVPASPPQGKR